MEFFVKEMLDFKKFDIIMVQGFKGKSISVEKIIKTTIDQLKRQAGSKFDPEMTVVKAKGLRNRGEAKQEETDADQQPQKKEQQLQPSAHTNVFKLPDNANKLNELVTIVSTYP